MTKNRILNPPKNYPLLIRAVVVFIKCLVYCLYRPYRECRYAVKQLMNHYKVYVYDNQLYDISHIPKNLWGKFKVNFDILPFFVKSLLVKRLRNLLSLRRTARRMHYHRMVTEEIYTFNIQITERLSASQDYFTQYQKTRWQKMGINLQRQRLKWPYPSIEMKVIDDANAKLNKILNSLDELVIDYNAQYMAEQCKAYKHYFDTAEKDKYGNPRGLNGEQRQAVVSDENHNLVNAGAGSGKTSVIATRVGYLLKKGIPKNKILLLTFTRSGRANMVDRIKANIGEDILVKTLHGIGCKVLKEHIGKNINVCDNRSPLVQKCFTSLMKDISFVKDLRILREKYACEPKPITDYTFEEYLESRKVLGDSMYFYYQQRERYRFLPGRCIYTLRNEKVRSFEEKLLADFLFTQGVDYLYEQAYQFCDKARKMRYRPDFYLPEYDIYIEHFGIDENGNVPSWFVSPQANKTPTEYYVGLKDYKLKLHREICGTKLIDLYSYQFRDKSIFDVLTARLMKYNVTLTPISNTESVRYITSNYQLLLSNFLSLYKSGCFTESDIKQRINSLPLGYHQARATHFFRLFMKFYKAYQVELNVDTNFDYDFDDLIRETTEILVQPGTYGGSFYSYIIVDEFQDTTIGQMKLLAAISQAPDCRVFCVGDDWQSIYGFNGADATLMPKYHERFPHANINSLATNYRSKSNIVKLGKLFVERNPMQLQKNTCSASTSLSSPTIWIASTSFMACIEWINDQKIIGGSTFSNDPNKMDVLVLGRYRADQSVLEQVGFLKQAKKIVYPKSKKIKDPHYHYKQLHVAFMSIHSVKGLEAPYVFLVPPDKSYQGFPSTITDDPVLNLVRQYDSSYPFSEERRALYVAITRAEKQFIVVNDNGGAKGTVFDSSFLQEIRVLIQENKLNSQTDGSLSEFSIDPIETVIASLTVTKVLALYIDFLGGWSAPCPFHNDSGYSLIVNNTEGRYWCNGCDSKGNKVDFVMKLLQCNYEEAIEDIVMQYTNAELKPHVVSENETDIAMA